MLNSTHISISNKIDFVKCLFTSHDFEIRYIYEDLDNKFLWFSFHCKKCWCIPNYTIDFWERYIPFSTSPLVEKNREVIKKK